MLPHLKSTSKARAKINRKKIPPKLCEYGAKRFHVLFNGRACAILSNFRHHFPLAVIVSVWRRRQWLPSGTELTPLCCWRYTVFLEQEFAKSCGPLFFVFVNFGRNSVPLSSITFAVEIQRVKVRWKFGTL